MCAPTNSITFYFSYSLLFRMATKSNNDCKSKREKLKDFENWPQWANLMQAMLEEKEFWDIVDGSHAKPTIAPQIWKKDKDNTIATKIIKQGVSTDLHINIIGEKNPQRSWKTLRQVCS